MLLIVPYSYNSFQTILVASNILKKYIDSDDGKDFLKNVFFFALYVDLSDGEKDEDSDKSDQPNYLLSEDDVIVPSLSFKITKKDDETADIVKCGFHNTLLTSIHNTYDKDPSLIVKAKDTMHFLHGDTNNNSNNIRFFCGKSKISDKMHILTEVKKRKWVEGSTASYNGELKITYIYGDIFFPFYLETLETDIVNFNICSDSENRTKYGYFSKAALNSNTNPDVEFTEKGFKFDGFFTLDTTDNVKKVKVTESDLPFPSFESNTN